VRALLASAIDILDWLESDATTDARDRVDRDRRIGKTIVQGPRYKQVLAWWAAIAPPEDSLSGERIVALLGLSNGVLALIGTLLGASMAAAVFSYQGDYPVNLFALLGILVGLPLVMLAASLLALVLPFGQRASVVDPLRVINPGRWAGSWLERQHGVSLFASVSKRARASRFARWQLIAFSQTFTIGYFAGVLIIAFMLVVFTDLAFGWSTTLKTDATVVQGILKGIATPWAHWMPAAVPDETLIEASRFYRLDETATSSATLGQWWSFVLMTIMVYGLAPRLIMALIASWQLNRATRRLLEAGPEIDALIDRLRTPAVTFESPDRQDAPATTGKPPLATVLELTDDCGVAIWNEAVTSEALGRLRSGPVTRVEFIAEWESAQAQREHLRALAASDHRVVILTKGWEPPLLAFLDFISLIREELGHDVVLVVVPLDTTRTEVRPEDREVWSNALARLDDANLLVASAV
jgi:hypothetical protein